MTTKLAIFIVLSLPLTVISYKSIIKPSSHGFYRYFSWECILWLAVYNINFWFKNPLSYTQIISWILLLISVYAVLAGVIMMHKFGRAEKNREGSNLYSFEKTTRLLEKGIFRYIRHPLYSSLVFLTWGIYFKNPDLILLPVALASSVFLYLTAIHEEKENIEYFGSSYKEYMTRSKMFIPFVF